jgi:hypothetical protein
MMLKDLIQKFKQYPEDLIVLIEGYECGLSERCDPKA